VTIANIRVSIESQPTLLIGISHKNNGVQYRTKR
jgi:hypothetical protein